MPDESGVPKTTFSWAESKGRLLQECLAPRVLLGIKNLLIFSLKYFFGLPVDWMGFSCEKWNTCLLVEVKLHSVGWPPKNLSKKKKKKPNSFKCVHGFMPWLDDTLCMEKTIHICSKNVNGFEWMFMVLEQYEHNLIQMTWLCN